VPAPDLFAEFHYRDALGGIAFLERALAFERYAVWTDDAGAVDHAELRAGSGFVMMASLRDGSEYAYRTPREMRGASTGSIYLGTPDPEALFARATAARAEIVDHLARTDYGSLGFALRDWEGLIWNVGSYRPLPSGGDPYAAPEAQCYPSARYRDARAAIRWLGEAFGFREQLVVEGTSGRIDHAELAFGSSAFMTGSARHDRYHLRTPNELDGAFTHVVCGYVDDPDAHCARARAAGAEIAAEPADTPYGARLYVARDPEGYVWCFGTYRPGTVPPA
jgi:uncharacterized glyoxalase superfamily protein PhnB